MRRLILPFVLVLLLTAGCRGELQLQHTPAPVVQEPPSAQAVPPVRPDPPQFRPVDLSGVDRIRIEHPLTRERMVLTGQPAVRMAAAFASAAATPTDKFAACAPDVMLTFFAGDKQVAAGSYNQGACFAMIFGENAIRDPHFEMQRQLNPIVTLLARGLSQATVLVAGAGQSDTVTFTDAAVIGQAAHALITVPPSPAAHKEPSTLYYIWFQREGRTFAHLWIRAAQESREPQALRFDDDTEWWSVSPEAKAALHPLLLGVPGMKVPW